MAATEVATSNPVVVVEASTVDSKVRAAAAATVPEYATTSLAVSIAAVYALATTSLLARMVASAPEAPRCFVQSRPCAWETLSATRAGN